MAELTAPAVRAYTRASTDLTAELANIERRFGSGQRKDRAITMAKLRFRRKLARIAVAVQREAL